MIDYNQYVKESDIIEPEEVNVSTKDLIDGDNIIRQWYDLILIESR